MLPQDDDADDDKMVAKLLKTLNLLFKEGRGCSWGESAYDIGPELLIAHQVRLERPPLHSCPHILRILRDAGSICLNPAVRSPTTCTVTAATGVGHRWQPITQQ